MADINNPDDKFSPYHNLTAYLTKGKKSDGFDDMIDFLCRSKIHHALTVNPTIYIPHMEDFWNIAVYSTAVYSTEQGISQIKAKVDGKDIIISEATLRKHLQLQDEGAAISYSKEEYMRTFKRSGWHQVSSALASVIHGMITEQGFNFAHLIFEGLRYNLQEGAKQQFFTYPRFNQELKDLSKPARIYIMLGHKNNIFQSMRIVSKKFSGVNVLLLSTMVNIQSTQGDSSAIPADTDPTPSTPHPEKQVASIARTPVQTTKDAQVQKSLTPLLDVIVQLEHRAPVATTYTRKRNKKTPSLLVSKAQSQPQSPHSESQNSGVNIKRDSHNIREISLEASLLGSGSHPGSIEQLSEPFHFSSLNLSAEAPCQDDIPSPTTTISEVLIDLAADAPNPSSSPKKDSDNIAKTLTTATHSEDVSFETLFTERNPRRQENQGDGDAEARPKAPSSSKDSTTMDEDRLKLHNLELTARVAMLEAEVSKLRHQVSMHEAHQCPSVTTPSLISVGTQTDKNLCTDATKKGEVITHEDDADSLEEWIQEQTVFQSSLYKPAFVQIHDLPDSVDEEEDITEDWKLVVRVVDEVLQDETLHEDTPPSFSILPEAAAIISQTSTPQFTLSSNKLEFDSILAWGYDGIAERFWIGWEFSGVEELNWNTLNALQVLNLYLTRCVNTSSDLSAELAICRFYDLMEDNMPWFERLLTKANRVAYPESSSTAEQRLAPRRLDLIRSSALTEEEVI
ncbi:hypothetical protein L1987_17964 [Smallanthus sonchifolius]|uniref:Uncharacterized protein n=1 Tax=Smallanthus sonchifolius TaxID=185202 RepID=A0ACB9J0Z3_9ASTR|nr:hypothetical protein L1987_17964 [Smallanthus sonchifolius]